MILKTSVDSILAPFAKMKEQLQTLAKRKGEAIETRYATIEALEVENEKDSIEGQRAMLAADRLQWMMENPATTPPRTGTDHPPGKESI